MEELRKTAVIIVNPASGRGKSLFRAQKARKILEEAGLECLLFQTSGPGHGREIARNHADQADVLVCVGGDGTLNEVLNGLANISSDTPIAMIPAGTANVVSKELGLPKDFSSQVLLAVKSSLRRLDLGFVKGKYFIMCAGAGFDASVVNALSRGRTKQGLTPWRLIFIIIREAVRYRYLFPSIRVKVDGFVVNDRSTLTVVGNMARYGGIFRLFKEASPEDGYLDVCCLEGRKIGDLLRYAWAAYRKSLHKLKDVSFYRGKVISLESNNRVLFQIDGDPCGDLPVSIEVKPRTVSFCVPFYL